MDGIAFAFGVRVQRAAEISTGLIANARGGASIESLVPERELLEHPLNRANYEHVQ